MQFFNFFQHIKKMDEDTCDYYFYGDTRNRRGYGLTKHNTGYKEKNRIDFIKEKRRMQREAAKGINRIKEEMNNKDEDVKDENYGNNYIPIKKKEKEKTTKKRKGSILRL